MNNISSWKKNVTSLVVGVKQLFVTTVKLYHVPMLRLKMVHLYSYVSVVTTLNGENLSQHGIQQMRGILRDNYNMNDVIDLSITEVQQLFDEYEVKQVKEELFEPTFSSLGSNRLDCKSDLAVDFLLSDGAYFIQDKRIQSNELCDIIDIFSGLVTYSSLYNTSEHKHIRAVPDIVAEVARGCRVDGGQRLMKRANRHAMDPRCRTILEALADG